jgi:molybdate transport system substrate-binding protein
MTADPANQIVRIDAAASIAHVIEDLAGAIEDDLGVTIAVNAGASGILAQQIARGDQADLFISADSAWMDSLDQQGLIDKTTRADLAGNHLVLVGLKDTSLRPKSLADLSHKKYQPIAVGDPAYVPAGRYAMQAFVLHGIVRHDGLRLAEAPSVRAALNYVLAGQCPVGIIYASDVASADNLDVLLVIDPADHDSIRYPAAVLLDASDVGQALRVLDWLKGDKGRAAFRSAGFDPAR